MFPLTSRGDVHPFIPPKWHHWSWFTILDQRYQRRVGSSHIIPWWTIVLVAGCYHVSSTTHNLYTTNCRYFQTEPRNIHRWHRDVPNRAHSQSGPIVGIQACYIWATIILFPAASAIRIWWVYYRFPTFGNQPTIIVLFFVCVYRVAFLVFHVLHTGI